MNLSTAHYTKVLTCLINTRTLHCMHTDTKTKHLHTYLCNDQNISCPLCAGIDDYDGVADKINLLHRLKENIPPTCLESLGAQLLLPKQA